MACAVKGVPLQSGKPLTAQSSHGDWQTRGLSKKLAAARMRTVTGNVHRKKGAVAEGGSVIQNTKNGPVVGRNIFHRA